LGGDGKRIIDQAFPKEIRTRTIDYSMTIHLKNGSIWQCVGSDNYNSLVGSNPVGIVMSEYSIADPAAWDYLRPILAQNGGWAMFIYTPRGRNHGQKLFTMAAGNPDWFAEILTVDDTKILPASVIEEERKSGMSDDMLRQEYYCDFNSAIVGAHYGREITNAETSGRVCDVAYDRNFPVDTCWDIGIRDSTSIWFRQRIGRELRVIDYYEHSGEGLAP
jgi:phage terminase large subunit